MPPISFAYGDDTAAIFILSAASTLTAVSFGSWNKYGEITGLNWSIDAVGPGNTLGAVLASGSATLSNVFIAYYFSNAIETSSFSLPAVALASGSYYLDLSGATGAYVIGWDLNGNSGNILQSGSSASGTAAFTITGTATPVAVPEPVSMALLGTGLLGLIAARRRRG